MVGVVTSPGPKQRRSPAYLEVVAAVPPGIDVIVSNHPERWAAMLAPLRPDLIISGGFLADSSRSSRCLGSGRSTCTPHCCLGAAARPPSSGPFVTRTPSWALPMPLYDFDTGPILAQTRIPIADDDDIDSLVAKFGPVLPDLLGQALERVARRSAVGFRTKAEETHPARSVR